MRISTKAWSAVGVGILLMAGALVFSGVWVPFEAFDRRPRVVLTGKDKSGRVEVPVINLWEHPGFGSDNHVAARVRLPADGQVPARLVSRTQADGLEWYQVRVDAGRGWVISRFVVQ